MRWLDEEMVRFASQKRTLPGMGMGSPLLIDGHGLLFSLLWRLGKHFK